MQRAHQTIPWEEQAILFYALGRNILDILPPEGLEKFKSKIYGYILSTQSGLLQEISEGKTFTNAIKSRLEHVARNSSVSDFTLKVSVIPGGSADAVMESTLATGGTTNSNHVRESMSCIQ